MIAIDRGTVRAEKTNKRKNREGKKLRQAKYQGTLKKKIIKRGQRLLSLSLLLLFQSLSDVDNLGTTLSSREEDEGCEKFRAISDKNNLIKHLPYYHFIDMYL